ncbi:hypothetical protein FISHEDRAFT_39999, partial [Fistulina hepatica ATCC 64428]
RLNKNKKLVKKLAKKFRVLSAQALIFGASAGKFPTPVSHTEDLSNKITEVRSTIKFQLKKVLLHSAIAYSWTHCPDDRRSPCSATPSINFLVSLLKKNWQNVKSLHIKTTMGKPVRLF